MLEVLASSSRPQSNMSKGNTLKDYISKAKIIIEDDNSVFLESSDVAKLAKDKFDKNNQDVAKFDPNFANPIYKTDTTYKKINE